MSLYARKKRTTARGAARGFKSTTRYSTSSYGRSRLQAARGGFSIPRAPAALTVKSNELGALDLVKRNWNIDTTGTITAINLVAVGSSFFNRRGRRMEMKSLRVRGIINPIDTVAAADYARILVVYDRQTNGALPSITNILLSCDQAGTTQTTSHSGPNLNERDRYLILMDQAVVLPSQTVTAGQISTPGWVDQGQCQFYIDRYIKLKGLVTQFRADSASAVIGDISTGGLYLITLGANVAGGFQLTAETRLRFADN